MKKPIALILLTCLFFVSLYLFSRKKLRTFSPTGFITKTVRSHASWVCSPTAHYMAKVFIIILKEGVFKSVHYKEGVLEGISKTYYLNQQLESLVPYLNGLPHGKASWYTKEGQLKQEANYQEGKLEGWVNHYYPEGPLQARYYYEKDQKKGPGYDYYLNGQLKNWHFFNITGRENFALSYDENGDITEVFGEIMADLEVDRAALSWDNQFSVGIQVAVPPGFTGEVSVEKKGDGQQSIQKGTLKPHQNTWRYRTRQLAKKEYVFYVSARITEPSGFSLSSKTRVIRLDLNGKTPQIMYE